nr:RNA-directed DNA polymerase, eukaryota, reverse transcriptase zinc-binding domain protein [Tanacetum cinerariifolium]
MCYQPLPPPLSSPSAKLMIMALEEYRIFHSWFDRIDFEKVVKDKWDDITGEVLGLASDEDKSSRISKLQELDYFEKMSSLDLMQKARVKWEVEGDKNSKFFHGLINSRRKSQSIHGIMHEGDLLEAVVFMEEIKTVVWDCGSNKAPGPDGYSFLFVKRFWDILKHDIQEFVVSFFSSGKFPQGVNSAFITLIPKVSNPLFIKDYRPISLIGLHYNIVAKILSNRLSKVIDSTISPEQSTFISGRQILDGPLILSEIIDWYKKCKKKMMLFKVDFEKAFDSVRWKYLDYMLHKLGFDSRWCTWINNCLMSARTSILINGSPTSEFSLKRGLRKEILCRLSYSLLLLRILNIFYIAFGLKINFHKSNVFGVGVSKSEVVSMAACTGYEADCRDGKLTSSPLAVVLLLSKSCLKV